MKRIALIGLYSVLMSCNGNDSVPHAGLPAEISTSDVYHAAFLITDGVYNTELTAPYDIFDHTRFREGIKPIKVFTISDQSEAVTTFEGLKILPDYNFNTDTYPPIDILVVPSAEHHMDTDLENEALIDFVRTAGKTAQYITSHCDGAFVLAKAGLLDSCVSTTFPADIEAFRTMFPHLNITEDVYFVHDGRCITSAGGARSFEAALYLTEVLYGAETARQLANGLVIDWELADLPYLKIESGHE